MAKSFSLSFIALLLVAALIVSYQISKPIPMSLTDQSITEDWPDAFVVNATALKFNELGQREYLLKTDKGEHLKKADTSQLYQPNLTLYKSGKEPWTISSIEAEVAPENEFIDLSQNVKIVTQSSKGPTQITSSTMRVIPDKEFAETDQAVTISGPNGVMSGVGMKSFLEKQKVYLESQVRGQYVIGN